MPTLDLAGEPPLLSSWLCCVKCTPKCGLPSWLPWHTAASCWACCHQHPQVSNCTCDWHLHVLVTSGVYPCFISCSFWLPSSLIHVDASTRPFIPPESEQYLPVYYHQWSCWGCIQLLHPELEKHLFYLCVCVLIGFVSVLTFNILIYLCQLTQATAYFNNNCSFYSQWASEYLPLSVYELRR